MPKAQDIMTPETLKQALKTEGRSIKWLAQQTGYAPGYIYNVLSGAAPLTPAFGRRVTSALR